VNVNALEKVLANSEKSRAEHAQQTFNCKGMMTWFKGLNPFVINPAKFLYIPTTWDGMLVVLGYGITYENAATGWSDGTRVVPVICALCHCEGSQDVVSEQRNGRCLTTTHDALLCVCFQLK
jgi:hypothetical protein